jgi:hypothetical protein
MKKSLAFLSGVTALTLSLSASPLGNNTDIDKEIKLNSKWQLFGFNEEIDLEKSFGSAGSLVKLVWGWDNQNEGWLAYSPEYSTRKKLEELADANDTNIEKITVVDTLKPNQGFWIVSYEDTNVSIHEVFYPLYDICLNVNSEDFWEDNNYTEIPERCESYINNLSPFNINDEVATLNGTTISGQFKTNLPIVFFGDFEAETSVPLLAGPLNSFLVDANGSVSNFVMNVTEEDDGSLVVFTMDITDAKDSTNYLDLNFALGYDVNFTNLPQFNIPVTLE